MAATLTNHVNTEPGRPVALVNMPLLSANVPAFQTALLKPTLEGHGIEVQSYSLHVYFGAHIGWRLNEVLADVWASMVGEWVWSRAAFGEFGDEQAYLERYERNLRTICERGGCTVDDIRRVREEGVFSFVEFCLDAIDWSRFGLIGFSVLFQQQLATLVLSRELKDRFPEIPIIWGGGLSRMILRMS